MEVITEHNGTHIAESFTAAWSTVNTGHATFDALKTYIIIYKHLVYISQKTVIFYSGNKSVIVLFEKISGIYCEHKFNI
jgi:hypothetical protein